MSNIPQLKNIPEISFIEGKTLKNVNDDMLADFEAKLKELTGENLVTDKYKLTLMAAADMIYQAMRYIDDAGKSNLLKYSRGSALENLAIFKGITRSEATAAFTVLRYNISAVRAFVVPIPIGSRVATDSGVYFATVDYGEIQAGESYVEVRAYCLSLGSVGNGFAAGEINNIVDPIPYISSVSNTTTSAGGAEVGTDEELTEQAYEAPASYSVAGPYHAYEFWAKQFRSDVEDVKVSSPSAMNVSVVFALTNGELPDATTIAEMQRYLSSATIRPLTDVVTASAPVETDYTISLSYYVNTAESANAVAIQTGVTNAINEYKNWQRKIGRDINPSELIRRCMEAGAKRVALTSPAYTVIDASHIANCTLTTATYGGLEDE